MQITLDIETLPTARPEIIKLIHESVKPPCNIKKQETIDKWWEQEGENAKQKAVRKTSLSGSFGQIYCIGFKPDGQECRLVEAISVNEAECLKEFFNQCKELKSYSEDQHFIAGHNVRNFDLLFIKQRSMILGVPYPKCLPDPSKRYSDMIFDTMIEFAGFGNYISLNELALAFGFDEKQNMDGSKVYDYFLQNRHSEVYEYCRNDVVLTNKIFNRMNFKG